MSQLHPLARKARLGIDIGGTFTDFMLDIDGQRHTHKLLSTTAAPEQAVLAGVQDLLLRTGLAAGEIGLVIHGTTLATNALIERKGARTAFLTTAGFRDVLEMGTESRSDQYDLFIDKPAALVPRNLRFTIAERMAASGEVLLALDETALEALAQQLRQAQVDSLAIGFLHSYRNGAHERRAGALLAALLPGLHISLSCDVAPEIREYERFSTTCVNAFIQPLMAGYLQRLSWTLKQAGVLAPLFLMQSNGGICDLQTAQQNPVLMLESGPAGGAIFAATVARELQLGQVMSLDIGGTTAKLCFIDEGAPQTARSLEVARLYRFKPGSGIPLRIPVIELAEIGAGGGSIAAVDQLGRVQVGPASAGADPGPVCYGRGGRHATITDAHLACGRIDPDYFAGGTITLDSAAAGNAIRQQIATALDVNEASAAYAVCELADEAMANTAREHGIEAGKSIAGRTMIAFGGSAPLHAARLASKLGITRVVIPAFAGVGSALGFLHAPVACELSHSLFMSLGELDADGANRLMDELAARAGANVALASAGAAMQQQRHAYMRYRGQGHELRVGLPLRALAPDDGALLRSAFETVYLAIYGRLVENTEVEVISWVVRFQALSGKPVTAGHAGAPPRPSVTATPDSSRQVFDQSAGTWQATAQYMKRRLAPLAHLPGPAIVVDDETTIVVPRLFDAWLTDAGHLIMEQRALPACADRHKHIAGAGGAAPSQAKAAREPTA